MDGGQGYHMFNYNIVMRERFSIFLDVLELGYNILMHDADIFWVTGKDPHKSDNYVKSRYSHQTDVLPDLERDRADIVAQQDSWEMDEWTRVVCGGFVLYKSRSSK